MQGTTEIQFRRGVIFRYNGNIYRVAFTIGKHMALDRWQYSERTSGWVFTQGGWCCWIIEAYKEYARRGEIEVLAELPAEVQ